MTHWAGGVYSSSTLRGPALSSRAGKAGTRGRGWSEDKAGLAFLRARKKKLAMRMIINREPKAAPDQTQCSQGPQRPPINELTAIMLISST